MSRKAYHVVPGEHGWKVKGENAQRASSVHSTKHEAVGSAKELAKAAELGQIVIHGKNGKIQTEHTYGNDPESSPG